MITIRKSEDRGQANHGWLDARHSFSFAEYYDPRHMSFRSLRVINEDKVAGGGGFGTHPHRDMEIITYILAGALEHKDSMGNSAVMKKGEVQRITAGTGISHSEFNHSPTEPVHLLQIWITPDAKSLKPGYDQKSFAAAGPMQLVASKGGREGSIHINQDTDLYLSRLGAGAEATHALKPGRGAWVQVAKGSVSLNGEALAQGDGAAVENEALLQLKAKEESEVLIFDLK